VQAAATEAEAKAEAEALLAALARQSAEEQRLAARLWQLGQEKEVQMPHTALTAQTDHAHPLLLCKCLAP
jgi:hypothetical protein